MSADETEYVFVYGTLKRGGGLNSYLNAGEFISDGKLDNNFTLFVPDYNGGFPMLTEEPSEQVCEGELFKIPKQLFNILDRVEGVPSLYVRKTVDVNLDNGSTVKAHTYIFNRSIPKGFIKSNKFNITERN